jgi:hypothetical protein
MCHAARRSLITRLCILCRAIGLDLSRGSDNDVSGDMKCPAGQTIKIGTLDAAQNPSCVKCGGHLQFACSESCTLLSCHRATRAWRTSSCTLWHCTTPSRAHASLCSFVTTASWHTPCFAHAGDIARSTSSVFRWQHQYHE